MNELHVDYGDLCWFLIFCLIHSDSFKNNPILGFIFVWCGTDKKVMLSSQDVSLHWKYGLWFIHTDRHRRRDQSRFEEILLSVGSRSVWTFPHNSVQVIYFSVSVSGSVTFIMNAPLEILKILSTKPFCSIAIYVSGNSVIHSNECSFVHYSVNFS